MTIADRQVEQTQSTTSSHRAIVEAIADWRYEARRATSITAAAAVHARSAIAIVRVLTNAALIDAVRVVGSGAGLWLLAWLAAPMVLNHVMWTMASNPHAWAMGLLGDFIIVYGSAPLISMLAVATARRRVEMPILGVVVVTCLLQITVAKWGWAVLWAAMMRGDAAWWLSQFNGHHPEVSVLAVLGSLPFLGVASLIGGRIRTDRRRWLLAVTMGVLWFVLSNDSLRLARMIAPSPLECSVQHVFLEAYRPAIAAVVTSRWTGLAAGFCVLFWLARRQSRTGVVL